MSKFYRFWLINGKTITSSIISFCITMIFVITFLHNSVSAMNDIVYESDNILLEVSATNQELNDMGDNSITMNCIEEKYNDIIYSLYDEYSYVLFDTNNERTDMTIKQLKTGISEMEDRNINPHLLFNIISLESGTIELFYGVDGNYGYGNVSEIVYETMFEVVYPEDHYFDKNIPLNGEIAIILLAEYLDYLLSDYSEDLEMFYQVYNGRKGNSYKILDEYIQYNTNTSLSEIVDNYKKHFDDIL